MSTAIAAARLVEIRQQAAATPTPRFVNPFDIAKVQEILTRRGETWAAAVLGRHLVRRSLISARWPWLTDSDVVVLRLADVEEDRARFEAITDGPSLP